MSILIKERTKQAQSGDFRKRIDKRCTITRHNIKAEPDYIFCVLQGSDPGPAMDTLEQTLLKNPAWNSLEAVREGRFYTLEHELYNLKPNARWGEAYEKLAGILYAE